MVLQLEGKHTGSHSMGYDLMWVKGDQTAGGVEAMLKRKYRDGFVVGNIFNGASVKQYSADGHTVGGR